MTDPENLQPELDTAAQIAVQLLAIRPIGDPDSTPLTADQLTVRRLTLKDQPPIMLVFPQTIASQVIITDNSAKADYPSWTIEHPSSDAYNYHFTEIDIDKGGDRDPDTLEVNSYVDAETRIHRYSHSFPIHSGLAVTQQGDFIKLQRNESIYDRFIPKMVILIVGAQALDKRFPNEEFKRQVPVNAIIICSNKL